MERLLLPVKRKDGNIEYIDPVEMHRVKQDSVGRAIVYLKNSKVELDMTPTELADAIIKHSEQMARQQADIFEEQFQLEN